MSCCHMTDLAQPQAAHGAGAQVLGTRRVTIIGRGLLATALAEALNAPRADTFDETDLFGDASDSQLLVTASDGWDCRAYEPIQQLCVVHHASWLPVRTELGHAVIGPYYTAGVPGCVSCAELRRSLAD